MRTLVKERQPAVSVANRLSPRFSADRHWTMNDFVVPQGPVPTTLLPRTVQYQVVLLRLTAGVTLQVPLLQTAEASYHWFTGVPIAFPTQR